MASTLKLTIFCNEEEKNLYIVNEKDIIGICDLLEIWLESFI